MDDETRPEPDEDRADPELMLIQDWGAADHDMPNPRWDTRETDEAGNQHTYPDNIRP
jgi:hypothetical protein